MGALSENTRLRLMFCMFLSICGAVFVYTLSGHHSDILLLLQAVCTAGFLIAAPVIFASKESVLFSVPVLQAAILLLTMAAGFLVPALGFLVFIAGAVLIVKTVQHSTMKKILVSAGAAFIFGIWLFSYIANVKNTPVFEQKVLNGSVNKDILYESSIMGMIQTYGIPCTGIDGIRYMPYHWGSHYIFAGISNFFSVSPLQFYSVLYPVIFIPFIFSAFLLFVQTLQEDLYQTALHWSALCILFAGFAGFLPGTFLQTVPTGMSYFFSESHLMSIAFSCLILSLAVKLAVFRGEYHTKEKILVIAVIPLMIFITGIIKISALAMLCALYGYLWLRLQLFKKPVFLLSMAITFSLFLGAVKIAFEGDAASNTAGIQVAAEQNIPEKISESVSEQSFWRFRLPQKTVLFILVYFIWSWIFLLMRSIELKALSPQKLKKLFISGKTADMESILVLCVVGALPGVFVSITHGGAHYFGDFQNWVALAGTGAIVSCPKKAVRRGVTVCAVVFGLCALYNTQEEFLRCVRSCSKSDSNDTAHVSMYKILRELGGMSAEEKKHSIVFIPKSNRLYWDMLTKEGIPFLVPAVTGIAAYDNLPEKGFNINCYGYFSGYTDKLGDPEHSPEEIFACAAKDGFKNVIMLDEYNGKTDIIKIQVQQ